MLKVTTIGRLTADVELQSGKNTTFTGFNLAVNEGYKDNAYTEYLQCILFDVAAERFIKAGVKKGSLIWIEGKLRLKSFTKKSDNTQDKCMSVQITDWGYVPSGSKEKSEESGVQNNTQGSTQESEFSSYDEDPIEEEDLPF